MLLFWNKNYLIKEKKGKLKISIKTICIRYTKIQIDKFTRWNARKKAFQISWDGKGYNLSFSSQNLKLFDEPNVIL